MDSADAHAEQPATNDGTAASLAMRRRARWLTGLIISALALIIGASVYFGSRAQTPVQPKRLQSLANAKAEKEKSAKVPDPNPEPQSDATQNQNPNPNRNQNQNQKPLPILAELPSDTSAMLAEADAVTGQIVEQYPKDPDAFEMRARLHLYRGDTAEAVKACERCLELNPNYPYAYTGLGSVAAKRGDHESAAKHFREALRLAPDSSPARIGLANALIDLGNVDEGIKVLEQQIQASPREVEPYVLLGMAYTQQQNHEKAKEYYQSAVTRDPRHANARWGLANACARLGLTDEAREHRQEFQRLRAGERELRQQERQEFDDVAATRQDISALFTNVARVCIAHGDGSQAEQLWQRAAELHPQDTNSRQALAWYYLQQKRPLDTIRMLEELARLDPKNVSYPTEIARLHLTLNQFESAEKVLKELCATSQDPELHAALAQVYLRGRKSAEALQTARVAVDLDPTPSNFVLLSAAKELSGDLPGAMQSLQQAINKEPNNAKYREMYLHLQQRNQGAHEKSQ